MINKGFWKNKKVLITGHTGFKGSWMTLILYSLNAKVYGYGLDPISKPSFFDGLGLKKFLKKDFRKNIHDYKQIKNVIKKIKPDIIFHLAGQSSVLVSYKDPIDTTKTNIMGTVNILEASRDIKSIKSLVIITTDKVYENLEKKIKFTENAPLGGHDVYSGSKACAEIVTQSYVKSFYSDKKNKCNIATTRSGNCIGGGDWTKDRIVKDCAEAFYYNKNLLIRMPNATRPWQHVLEPIFGYLALGEKLFKDKKYIGGWNFAPSLKNNLKVKEVAYYGKKILNSKSKIKTLKQVYYESINLSLSSKKALKKLKWKNLYNAKESLKMSFDWYKFYYENKSKSKSKIINFTFKQINNYFKKINI